MTPPDDIDAVAAEYVLGTLDAAERADVPARRPRERDLDAAIRAWERRLAPLAEAIPPVDPPRDLWPDIAARIAAAAPPPANVIDLQRRLSRWRISAIAASAIAASLALLVGLGERLQPPPRPRHYVAVLQKDAASPAFLVSVDLDQGQLTVRSVVAQPQRDGSYELWLVHDRLATPRSLGLIGGAEFTVLPTLASYDRDVVETATFAVSLEPAGGSPTGVATGPILFVGKLLQATR